MTHNSRSPARDSAESLYEIEEEEEEEAVFISVANTNEDPPNAHQAQQGGGEGILVQTKKDDVAARERSCD